MKKFVLFTVVFLMSLSACTPDKSTMDKSTMDEATAEAIIEEFKATQVDEKPPQDWPNLKRFQEANSKLSKSTSNMNRVVFMGNSITEGWLNISPDYFKDKPYVNRGISGQTTPQMLVRFRQDVVDLGPSVVVILAGINDIAGNTGPSTLQMIFDNIMSMSEIAQANNVKVLLSSVLPTSDFPWSPGMDPGPKVVKLNAMLKEYAEAKGHSYVDYYSAMDDGKFGLKGELGDDGVHPDAGGYAIMEPILDRALEKVLRN